MKIKFTIPKYVQKVVRVLHKEGYKVHLVGGALRDLVLNIQPDDWTKAALLAHDQQEEALRI